MATRNNCGPMRTLSPGALSRGLLWFFSGAVALCLLATFQKIVLGYRLSIHSYLLPFMVGGLSGLSIRIWKDRMQGYTRRLRESERRYRRIYQNTPVMLHSIDRQGRLVTVSNFWLENLGYEREEVLGRKLSHFLTEESRTAAETVNIPEFFRIGVLKDIPYQMVKKNGEIIEVLLSAIADRDEEGEIERSLAVLIDVTERKKAESEIQKLAYFDTLTGLPNRILFQDRLIQAVAQARRSLGKVAVLFLDLDRFKGINDTLGHAAGDVLLRTIALRLKENIRQGDTVARLGGDEFVVVLTGFHDDEDLTIFAKKTLDLVSRPVRLGEKEIVTTASIGISAYPEDAVDVENLVRNADIAMYAAKEHGRNTYQFFSTEMNARVVEKLGLETSLRRAMEKEEFQLVYQPQLDLEAGRITSAEVLLRWTDPEKGMVSPTRFIPVAEDAGLIIAIGEWVLRAACLQGREWEQSGHPVRVAVNISSRQFTQPDFIDMVDRVLEETEFDPHLLELEITERVVTENSQRTIMTLTDLKIRGIRLAIDDFGTGYSSLLYLKHFPIDRIKIAQEFVQDIPHDADDSAIVEAIVAMGHSLGLDVIAEGVETREQLDFLHARGCTEMQGFYFAPPMPAVELTRILEDGMGEKGVCLFQQGERGNRVSVL